ncbi:PhoX family protein [Cupriavidus basilensis]
MTADTVTLPANYAYDVLSSAGDPVVAGAPGYSGSFQTSAETELQAGGNHDGMHFFPLPGVDPQQGGLLAINHETLGRGHPAPRRHLQCRDRNGRTEEDRPVLGRRVGHRNRTVRRGKWQVRKGSAYNKRYTGNTVYKVRQGPAAGAVGGTVVSGTLNNCSSGHMPWGTYPTCEETTDNYLDPTQPEIGYGWVVEIDPLNQLAAPTKRTAMGRFDHENTAFMTGAGNRVAFYMGDDSTPGCIYKFVPTKPFDPNRPQGQFQPARRGTLYVARFNADGGGQWIGTVTQGKNNLLAGATDPGNTTQGPQTPVVVNFTTQADVLVNTKAAARVAGGTLMDRPEWITVGPDKTLFCTLTNNGGRKAADAANPHEQLAWAYHPMEGSRRFPAATSFRLGDLPAGGDPLPSPRVNLRGHDQRQHLLQPGRHPRGSQGPPVGAGRRQGTGASTTNTLGANSMPPTSTRTPTARCKRVPGWPARDREDHRHCVHALRPDHVLYQHPASHSRTNGRTPATAGSSTVVVRHKDGKPIARVGDG